MKKTLLLGLTLALLGGSAFAKKKHERREQHREEMYKDLDLSADQKKQIDAIHAEGRKRHEADRKAIDSILTDEQKAKRKEFRKKRHQDRREKRKNRRGKGERDDA